MSKIGAVAFSRRMRQCLKLTAEGYTQKEIGLSLGITRRTVNEHLTRARLLTGARSLAHLVAICMKEGILEEVEIDKKRRQERRDELFLVDRMKLWEETGVDFPESG